MTASAIETIEIQNVVATTEIDQELDLDALAQDLTSVSYDPGNHPGAIYGIEEPTATVFIFRTGTIVCTGAQSVPDAQEAIQLVVGTLRTLDILVPEDPTIVVQNIVSSADLGHQLNLPAIALGFGLETVEYEPEQFPGLIYWMDTPAVVVLLFGSGKLVIVGGQTLADTAAAVDSIGTQLAKHGLLQ